MQHLLASKNLLGLRVGANLLSDFKVACGV